MSTIFNEVNRDKNPYIFFNDFQSESLPYREEIIEAVNRVIKSGWYILGNELRQFEENFANYIGVKYCIGVASGTEAIALSLMASRIGPGCEVITTNLTAFPTITAIMQTGAQPVVVDIFENTGLINWQKIEDHISEKTRAIVPVHLYGQSCNMAEIMTIARRYGLFVVEDCAQATGATFMDTKCGAIGDCGAFSFYPTKNLGAYGDAGAITTNDENLYQQLISLRNYGQAQRYYHDHPGINSRMDELQAAILNVKLPYLETKNDERKSIAHRYRQGLKKVTCLTENDYGQHANHLFVIKSPRRKQLMEYLESKNVQTLIHYPVPVTSQKAFQWQKDESLPESEKFANSILSLPIYPELSKENINYVIEVINEFEE